jgi:hypothetical protein
VASGPGVTPTLRVLPTGVSAAGLSARELAPLSPGRESLYWYSLFTSHNNCWQAGEPRESFYLCDNVGGYYLPTGPHMLEGAVTGNLQLTHSGDYCNYYNIGEVWTPRTKPMRQVSRGSKPHCHSVPTRRLTITQSVDAESTDRCLRIPLPAGGCNYRQHTRVLPSAMDGRDRFSSYPSLR